MIRYTSPLSAAIDELFDGLFSAPLLGTPASLETATYADRSELRIPVPGFAPEQVAVSVADRRLTVELERDGERARRSFALPVWVDSEAIVAGVEHGLLTIRLPRSAASQPRQIAVGGALPALGAGEKQLS